MRKYAFHTGADANSYLSDCLIFLQNSPKPISVQSLFDPGGAQIICHSDITPEGAEPKNVTKSFFLNSEFEVRKFPSLGYITIGEKSPQAYYLSRSALRGMKQGLHSTNVSVTQAPYSGKAHRFNTLLFRPDEGVALKNLFSGQFFDPRQAEEKALEVFSSRQGMFAKAPPSTGNSLPQYNSAAISRTLAIASDWKTGEKEHVKLLYKNKLVGHGSCRSGFLLYKDYTYLKEVLEEARLKVA